MSSASPTDGSHSRRPLRRLIAALRHSVLWRYDPVVGYRPVLERIVRIRMGHAFALSLPLLFLLDWYSVGAVVEHASYNRSIKEDQPLTRDLFHVRVFDRLNNDWRRLQIPDLGDDSALPVYAMHLTNDQLEGIEKNLPPGEGEAEYVTGFLLHDRRVVDAKFRIRGTRHWNWNYPQKSWKIRLLGNDYLDGRDVFNFVNPVDPVPYRGTQVSSESPAANLAPF